jgi:hypothetical protein
MNDEVYALTVLNNELYAGGIFTQVGGVGVNRIAKWTGSWSNLGTGVNGSVEALYSYGGLILAGGTFTSAGGVGSNRIAGWNGTNWAPYGTGMNNDVLSIAVYNNIIYAGGDFTTASGSTVNRVTRWSIPVAINQTGTVIPSSYSLGQNYPNPFNPTTNIKIQIPKGEYAKLVLYDVSGREAAILIDEYLNAGEYKIDFNASGLSSGVYYYELRSGDFKEVKKMILIK